MRFITEIVDKTKATREQMSCAYGKKITEADVIQREGGITRKE